MDLTGVQWGPPSHWETGMMDDNIYREKKVFNGNFTYLQVMNDSSFVVADSGDDATVRGI